jgi:hypothetical protein
VIALAARILRLERIVALAEPPDPLAAELGPEQTGRLQMMRLRHEMDPASVPAEDLAWLEAEVAPLMPRFRAWQPLHAEWQRRVAAFLARRARFPAFSLQKQGRGRGLFPFAPALAHPP